MTRPPSEDTYVRDPRMFSRGSLQMSFELLRRDIPTLALKLRNILGAPEPKEKNPHAQVFRVELEPLEVRSIVESLLVVVQMSTGVESLRGQEILAKSLLDEWVDLAKTMLDESLQRDSES